MYDKSGEWGLKEKFDQSHANVVNEFLVHSIYHLGVNIMEPLLVSHRTEIETMLIRSW